MRRLIVGLAVVATAAMAWESLDPVPGPAAVEDGACITYGADSIWGVFPTTEDEVTYAGRYTSNQQGDTWVMFEDEIATEILANTSVTFQWLEDGVFFVAGNDDGQSVLYAYNLHEGDWEDEDIEVFTLGEGACIAYQPNGNYNAQLYPVPGWIYCLVGGGHDFWRYTMPTSLPPVALDGIYPCQSSVIADQTPAFIWPDTGQTQYRLQVSTNSNFSSTSIDVTESASEYQATSALTDGTHYWRTGTPDGYGSWTWSSVHNFDLDGGWDSLPDIPAAVGKGAAMAYEADYYNHMSIIALVGGEETDYYEYDIVQGTWDTLSPTGLDQKAGTSLATHEATEEPADGPWCVFGETGTEDHPWYHNYPHGGWSPWEAEESALPQWIGPGSSTAYGLNDNLYLIVGEDSSGNPRNDFYRVQLPWGAEGPQSRQFRAGAKRARVVTRLNGVSVEYQLGEPGHVRATLHDASGRLVCGLDAGEQRPGVHQLHWSCDSEGQRLPSGTYFVLLSMGPERVSLKAVVR